MSEPLEQLRAWRDEIAAELGEAQARLAEVLAEQVDAEHERRDAVAHNEAWQRALARLRPPVAQALARRLNATDAELREADARLARAKSAVGNARFTVEDLLQAIREIDRIAPAEAVTAVMAEVTQ